MKRIRMFASVILVMVIMLQIMVLPAVAAVPSDETISPQAAATECQKCGASASIITILHKTETHTESGYNKCPTTAYAHIHEYKIYKEYIDCPNCGSYLRRTITKIYCMDVLVRTVTS